MKQLALLLLAVLCSLPRARAEEPVRFRDWNLAAAVEDALWISDPMPSDMQALTYLDATAQEIQWLDGLEYATNLRTLRLGDNQRIADVAPLAGLTSLTLLVLNQNRISDLSPLSGLVNLRELDIHHNEISDISPLSGLTNLRRLALRENPLRDISPLSGLAHLDDLILSVTEVRDLTPLLGLTALRRLDLRDCPLDPAAYDLWLPQIAANNPGIDILYDPWRRCTLMLSSSAGGRVIEPGEGTFTFGRGETVVLTARADPGFVFAGWSGGYNSMQNPLSVTVADDREIQASFLRPMIALFVDDAGPGDPQPGDPTGSDPREDGTAEHPFDTIQEAIDAAASGMAILVRPGTYRENIDFLGKNIRLLGINPNDALPAPYPVIEPPGAGPAVRFTRGEGLDCLLMGFVLRQGRGDLASAVLCDGAGPTLANCVMVGNRSTDPNGSAISCRDSHAALINCTIADNVAGDCGAALYLVDSDIVLMNSIVWGNRPSQILLAGDSKPSVTYTDIEGGWPDTGIIGAIPRFAGPGLWLNPDAPYAAPEPDDPRAVWTGGDYHLVSQAGRWNPNMRSWYFDEATSPCLDAGDPAASVGSEPFPNGGLLNLGAYGGTPQASKSPARP
jgi:hypothetical protein